MKKNILIIGGYGSVGRVIATRLSEQYPGQVIVAGRNIQKAEELALELHEKVVPMELDITAVSGYDNLLNDIGIVVMCLEQEGIDIARQCLKRGIHYVDISASYSVLSNIEELNQVAEDAGTTAVLSVGLAPGLTNLLVKYCQTKVPGMTAADIFVLLGLGESHGKAALDWTLENLNSAFSVHEDGKRVRVKSFTDGKKTEFPHAVGNQTAYRFNFSDQHVIPNTLGLQSASTRLCFDLAGITRLLALIKKTGISRVLANKRIKRLVTFLLQRMRIGSDIFIIKVEGCIFQKNEILYECSLSGYGEGRITGLVAAMITEKLAEASYPHGVFHIEQLFDLSEFLQNPDYYGLTFQEKQLSNFLPDS